MLPNILCDVFTLLYDIFTGYRDEGPNHGIDFNKLTSFCEFLKVECGKDKTASGVVSRVRMVLNLLNFKEIEKKIHINKQVFEKALFVLVRQIKQQRRGQNSLIEYTFSHIFLFIKYIH